MGFDYFVFYTEASGICILLLLMLLINDRSSSTQQEKQLWFNRAVIIFMLYFFSDACWAAMLSGIIPRIRFFVVLFNFTNFILMHMMAYGMFMFIAVSEKMPFRNNSRKRLLIAVPLAISTLVFIAAYFADPMFWINEQNELNSIYYLFMIPVPGCYFLVAFVFSIKNAVKAEFREDRKYYLMVGCIPIGVIAFGMLQVVALNAPTFCFGCTVMWLWFYLKNIRSMVSVDDLTNLNNRRQINRYMEKLQYSPDTKVYIMMMDINRFKSINDTYGHAEGDRALVVVSDALRQVCDRIKTNVFLGRYGGDEFTLILQNPGENEQPGEVCDMIRQSIKEKHKENGLQYELSISIGYDEIQDESDTAHECMRRADDNLYKEKKKAGKKKKGK